MYNWGGEGGGLIIFVIFNIIGQHFIFLLKVFERQKLWKPTLAVVTCPKVLVISIVQFLFTHTHTDTKKENPVCLILISFMRRYQEKAKIVIILFI